MKLSPEQIAKIEELLTDVEHGDGYRAVIVKYGIRDLAAISAFIGCFRTLGIDVRARSMSGGVVLRGSELANYRAWLAEQKAARQRKAEL